jgi:hypothetical protein
MLVVKIQEGFESKNTELLPNYWYNPHQKAGREIPSI